ncbi:MAG: 50S ribosomal protein L32 [Syntrophorhabdaceae bacterium]|nr:50S ribosomal protein L32 [Syntrophorhabdaceae bacterium]
MPVPKRKTSQSKRDKRRTHYKARPVNFVLCPNCKEPTLPHTVCSKCGYYKGKQVLKLEEI